MMILIIAIPFMTLLFVIYMEWRLDKLLPKHLQRKAMKEFRKEIKKREKEINSYGK